MHMRLLLTIILIGIHCIIIIITIPASTTTTACSRPVEEGSSYTQSKVRPSLTVNTSPSCSDCCSTAVENESTAAVEDMELADSSLRIYCNQNYLAEHSSFRSDPQHRQFTDSCSDYSMVARRSFENTKVEGRLTMGSRMNTYGIVLIVSGIVRGVISIVRRFITSPAALQGVTVKIRSMDMTDGLASTFFAGESRRLDR